MPRRTFYSIARSGRQATQGEEPVLVYNSTEYKDFKGTNGKDVAGFDSVMMSGPHKAKFFSLLPFQVESVSNDDLL